MALVPEIHKKSPKKKSVKSKSTTTSKSSSRKKVKPAAKPVMDVTPPKKEVAVKKVVRKKKVTKSVPAKTRRMSRKKKALIILGVIVVFGGLGSWSLYTNGMKLYDESLAAKDDFVFAQAALTEQRFTDAADNLTSAEQHLANAGDASDNLGWIKWVPWVSTQFKAVDNLLLGGEKIASALVGLSYVGDSIFSAIESDDVTISNITPKQRKAILEEISKSPETLRTVQSELAIAVDALNEIPDEGLLSPLAVATIPIKEQLPTLDQIVEKAIPFLEIVPGLVGYPDEKTYLFLLQNNTELRPTGGFIGTYGILILKNGDIKEFNTDNIYNLDSPKKQELFIDPPEAFSKYIGSTQWFMRDANWHPDFPITAEKVEEFYHLEDGPIDNIDGVIAMTPEVIHDLLELTGSITVDGEEYTSDNLTEKLQYKVEVGYRLEGTSDADRKEVIGDLAGQIMDRMLNLPKNQWGDLWTMAVENLDQKHLLIYSKDEQTQELVGELGWDGAMVQTDGDYLMVVDANLAALKTDRVMTKDVEYAITKDGDRYKANLTLKYYNDGTIGTFTTRYRTYTRIYVPLGSELVQTSGFLTNDRYLGGDPVSAKVAQDDKINRSIFEGFISVEPKTEEIITLEYYLPDTVIQQIEDGTYELYLQKQSGTDNVWYDFTFDIGSKIDQTTAVDEVEEMSNNKVHLSNQLDVDKEVIIELR